MTKVEALMWIGGQRSVGDQFLQLESSPEDRLKTLVLVAQYDAAMMDHALTVLRANREGFHTG